MKHKFTAIFLAVMCAAAACGATACGEKKPEPEEPVVETPDEEAPAFSDPAATLTLSGSIDKTTASQQISSDLFGLFLEDINYASYALDDNLIANNSFESKTGSTITKWSATDATLAATTEVSLFENDADFGSVNPTSARVSITAENGYLQNTGFDAAPIAVTEGVDYVFSAFVKAGDYSGTMKVEVTDGSTVYASKEISLSPSSEWIKYQATLTATGTQDSDLVVKISFGKTGTLYLDNVKLETTDSTIGIKNYLYDAIADLSPAFFRFPGGCVIEGTSDTTAYDWKNSIGAVAGTSSDTVPAFTYTVSEDGSVKQVTTYGEQATRTANTDIWGVNSSNGSTYYQMEYGLGFYEYFLLCDSLGASAIPIVNCGLSCQVQTPGSAVALKGRHGKGVEDFIQDAKDLVAFAKGSVDSEDENERYWATVRTNMGHPEPFEMDYLGIGNEQWGDYYTRYYQKFLESFLYDTNPLYQSVQLIVGNCTLFSHCENPTQGTKGVAQAAAEAYVRNNQGFTVAEYGVVDQHYYMNYTDFLGNAYLYDDYSRPADNPDGYYEVFVGEYSANMTATASKLGSEGSIGYTFTEYFQDSKGKRNTWMTALSEAAMMTGFERNGDIVRLAAYAPMFGNLIKPDTSNMEQHWAVNMMFFTATEVVLTPNYYVQQLFMKNSSDHKVASTLTFASGSAPQTTYNGKNGSVAVTRTLDDVYYVTSADEETGDIIVKIVNAGENEMKFNIALELSGVDLTGIAEVTELTAYPSDVSSLENGTAIYPKTYTIGAFTDGSTIGYTVQGYSVTAIRIHTK